MRCPRSYVVRIYRRDARSIAGLVEDTSRGSTAPFQSMEELWSLLGQPGPRRKRGSIPGAVPASATDIETS
ncbi:MAG: hypothetical protein U1F52_12060 [Burkholderiales bacterium]